MTYMWNLKNKMNELIYKTETDITDIENEHSYVRGKWMGKG